MSSEQVKNFLWQEGFPRFLIAYLLTLLFFSLESGTLGNFLLEGLGLMYLSPDSVPVQIMAFATTPILASASFLLLAILIFFASLFPRFEKIAILLSMPLYVLLLLLKKIFEIPIIKAVILVVFDDFLASLFYLLGFLVGSLPIPGLRSISIALIIFVFELFLFIWLSAYSLRLFYWLVPTLHAPHSRR